MSNRLKLFQKMYNLTKKPDIFSQDNLTEPLPAPRHVLVVLHNYCNFKCKMCKVWDKKDSEKMFLKTLYKIIKDISKFKSKDLILHFIGGETLLFKDLDKAIAYAMRNRLTVDITTNGYALNKNKIIALSEAGLRNINLSLDSNEKEVHNELRGVKDSYQKIMKAIPLLGKYGKNINVSINTVINSLNLSTLISLCKYVKQEKHLKNLYFIAMEKPFESNYDNDWRKTSDVAYLWPDNPDKINYVFDALVKETQINEKIGNTVSQLNAYKSYYIHPDKFIKKLGCRSGCTNLEINMLGEIFLCVPNPKLGRLGNIDSENIVQLWNSEKAFLIRQEMMLCKNNCLQVLSCGEYDEEVLT